MNISVDGHTPDTAAAGFIAPNATIVGNVTLGAETSIWYTTVLRGDESWITLGHRSNLQDGVVVHCDRDFPAVIGAGVSVGHRAVIHGCTIEDNCLIGMGALVLNGAVVGAGSLVAAGTVVTEGAVIPPRSLVAGVPGKVRRELADEQVAKLRHNADVYVDLSRRHTASKKV